ncbi:NDP-hexose 2,3-dehydratase family protein [Kitasatospora viridis]|uniref:Oxidase EvaA n=1 Tax=Kitasatospora viridis TaxID=281105 RepID=A0A561SFY3_9ACTN|nr:NDP-hexose 2,3-dehydratase family protein [Kitasatospora viridis]TWF73796.1 oxidase EvaA [Kitasatospora viridis]
MRTETPRSAGLLASSLVLNTPQTPDADAFLEARAARTGHLVTEVPLDALTDWRLDDRLSHVSGRFFTVEGLSVRTDFGPVPQWSQPVIVQPEIGILGIITKRIDGVPCFLMQAKLEPGNTELVQYAATVQATPSNYQRVHGGRSTPYLEYFREHTGRRIVFDQLLSEHASWYLHKRNRNMIVEVPEDEDVPVGDDFAWLTLGQLRGQLQRGNRVNMNARTVLSGLSYRTGAGPEDDPHSGDVPGDAFQRQVVASHRAGCSDADLRAAMTWLIDQKARFSLDVRRVGLGELDDWVCGPDGIRHREGRSFRIVGLSVAAASREVGSWSQPVLEPTPGNVVALVCRRRAGVLQVLVQAMVQPGLTDRLELAATVQLTPGGLRGPEDLPPLVEYLEAPEPWIRLRSLQSEDGGRFLRADTEHLVIEVPEDHRVEAPDNYRWMTLGLLNRLIRSGYYVNVEARSLVACML